MSDESNNYIQETAEAVAKLQGVIKTVRCGELNEADQAGTVQAVNDTYEARVAGEHISPTLAAKEIADEIEFGLREARSIYDTWQNTPGKSLEEITEQRIIEKRGNTDSAEEVKFVSDVVRAQAATFELISKPA